MYARGYGVDKNIATARKWWSFAAAQNDPGAQFNLGTLYFEGTGVAQDDAQAVRWYREAASRGHIQAQFNLGIMYSEGKGVEKDLRSAYYWLAVASEQGDEDARTQLKKVAANMSPAQITESEARAKEWMKNARKTWQ
jgi:TPR repeat protein